MLKQISIKSVLCIHPPLILIQCKAADMKQRFCLYIYPMDRVCVYCKSNLSILFVSELRPLEFVTCNPSQTECNHLSE